MGQSELHGLKFCDGLAELAALFGVANRVSPCALGQTQHLRANSDAALVERFDGDLVAFAWLSENIVLLESGSHRR